MKILQYLLLVGVLLTFFIKCSNNASNFDFESQIFDNEWKFLLDSTDGPQKPEYDDSKMKPVDLPHDWSILDLPNQSGDSIVGPFDKNSIGANATGYVHGGIAWYRKTFTLSKMPENPSVFLQFDGIYMEAEIWLNGKLTGKHFYGYSPFNLDVSQYLNKEGEKNILAIKVKNTGKNSRWYSGSGIYRHVWLRVTHSVHIANWGVHVQCNKITTSNSEINIQIKSENNSQKEAPIKIKAKITDPSGKSIETQAIETKIEAGKENVAAIIYDLKNPKLWSPKNPNLYSLTVSMFQDGKMIDEIKTKFGVRKIEYSAEKGLQINGESTELKGGCIHHDNGIIGAAAFDRAEERKIEILKANGYNAIRTSHNPPSTALLEACDKLGMLVIDEAFDMWEKPKNPQDYHQYFKDQWKSDLESIILRDRNHPSIIIWSIGNEIPERADSSGIITGKYLVEFVRNIDKTRPITNAICTFWDQPGREWPETAPAFELLDIGGYNYQPQQYVSDHEKFPKRIMMATESVAKDAYEYWKGVTDHSYVIGDFIWTAFDYLGETGIGHYQYLNKDEKDQFSLTWPYFNAWCGDLDICGNKKPQSFYRDVLWGNSLIEMAVRPPVPVGKTEVVSYWGWPNELPTWNWNDMDGKMMKVVVYSSSPEVELFINGKSAGKKRIEDKDKLTAYFDVQYQAGKIEAISFKDGKIVAKKEIITCGKATQLKIQTDGTKLKADKGQITYISIDALDENGKEVLLSEDEVKIEVTGEANLLAMGNAAPNVPKSFQSATTTLFRGKAQAIIRSNGKKGKAIIRVSSPKLKESVVEIEFQ